MEEKSILDTVFKTCTCCGKNLTLRNYRMIGKSEVNDGLTLIADMFSKVCKCCEKHPEQQLKSNRIANLSERRKHFLENATKREQAKAMQEMNKEKAFKIKKHKDWEKVNVC